MTADDIDEGRDRVVSLTPPRWRTVSLGISQFGLAMFFFGGGAVLLSELLTHDTVSIHQRVFLAALIGFLFLLSFIHLMILGVALRRPKEANSHAVKLAESTWSPFQSPELRDICDHLTLGEKNQLANQGAQSGRKIGTLLALPLVLVACSLLYSIRLFFVFLGLFILYAFVMEWRLIRGLQRRFRQAICATEYARARGYQADSLRMFSFPWSRKEIAGNTSEPD